jgi:hypothetical protein
VVSLGREPSAYGTHSMRRTKVAQIYKKTGNLQAVQLLLGHTKMDSTVRYLGVDIEDAFLLGADRPVTAPPTGAPCAGPSRSLIRAVVNDLFPLPKWLQTRSHFGIERPCFATWHARFLWAQRRGQTQVRSIFD